MIVQLAEGLMLDLSHGCVLRSRAAASCLREAFALAIPPDHLADVGAVGRRGRSCGHLQTKTDHSLTRRPFRYGSERLRDRRGAPCSWSLLSRKAAGSGDLRP